MLENEDIERVLKIYNGLCEVGAENPNLTQRIELDSISSLAMIQDIEDAFSISLSETDLLGTKTFGELCTAVANKLPPACKTCHDSKVVKQGGQWVVCPNC